MKKLPLIPKNYSYFMPPEFSEHDGTLMIMPFRGDVWRSEAKLAQDVFLNVAKTIAEYEKVWIGVHPTIYPKFKDTQLDNIQFFELLSDDAWMRDVGPTIVKNAQGECLALDWAFNAYGGKEFGLYAPWDNDDQVANKVAKYFKLPTLRIDDFIMEGGAFHVDGDGLVMATEYNLLHPGRNPDLTKAQIEKTLLTLLGGKKMIWIPRGIYHDETREHVDNVATFIAPGHVLMAECVEPKDAQYPLSQLTRLALESQTDCKGQPLKISTIVMPKAIHRTYFESAGLSLKNDSKKRPMNERLAASYLNLYFVNGALIVPKFNQKTDDIALAQLKEIFPDRDVIMLDSREILLGGGNIHCITQQIPKGVL
jgi:agmatine deiminase